MGHVNSVESSLAVENSHLRQIVCDERIAQVPKSGKLSAYQSRSNEST